MKPDKVKRIVQLDAKLTKLKDMLFSLKTNDDINLYIKRRIPQSNPYIQVIPLDEEYIKLALNTIKEKITNDILEIKEELKNL